MHAPGPEKSLVEHAHYTARRGNRRMPRACSAAAEECPQPVRATGTARPAPLLQSATPIADTLIEYEADGVEATRWPVAAPGRCPSQAGRADAEDAQCEVQRRGAELQRRRGRRGRRSEFKASGSLARVDQTGGATFEGAQFELKDRNARRRGPHSGHARSAAQAQRRALHDMPGRRGRLGTAGRRYRHPPARRTSVSAAACGWISRACRFSTRRSSPFRSATSANRGSCFRRSGLPAQRLVAGPVVLEHRAELRRDVRADLVLQARRQARQRVPLPDRPGPRHARSRVPAGRRTSSATRAATCTSSTAPTSPTRCGSTSTRRTSATATGSRTSAWARKARASAISSAGQPHVSHAALAGGAARAELSDDRRRRHSARSCGRTPCCRSWRCTRLSEPAGEPAVRSRHGGRQLHAQLRRPRDNRLAHGCRAGDPLAAARRRHLPGAGRELALHVLSARRHGPPLPTIRPAAPRRLRVSTAA